MHTVQNFRSDIVQKRPQDLKRHGQETLKLRWHRMKRR